jgi:phosphoglycolate phosphatase-like HAD superfamily hydrolase
MKSDRFVFLDFDGTLSDPARFKHQYVREVGRILAPQFGGDDEAWASAVSDTLDVIDSEYSARFGGNPLAGYRDWLEPMRVRSVQHLFRRMNLSLPEAAHQLAVETQFNALIMCDATYHGASEALTALYQNGYRVQIASGQESQYLIAALMGAGIESFTESKFGPDLIDCAKEGPEYFERVFEATGVLPGDTLVVDDHPDAIAWARSTGAPVIQARLGPLPEYPAVDGVPVVTDLRKLPQLIVEVMGTAQ